jgi:hypothetical protein
MYWWEGSFYTFSATTRCRRASTLKFPSVETLAGEVLEKADELEIIVRHHQKVAVRITTAGECFSPVVR